MVIDSLTRIMSHMVWGSGESEWVGFIKRSAGLKLASILGYWAAGKSYGS